MRIASRQYSDERHLADIDALLVHSPDAVGLLFERACALEDLGWDEAAMQGYLAVLKRDPHHLGALTNLGLMVSERGDPASGRALFTQALTHHPRAPIANVNLGQALLEQGEAVSAEAQFNAALAVDPDFMAAHHGLALLYERLGQSERAERQWERAFEKRAAWTLPYAGTEPPLRVLLLVSARGGDIVTHPFLDDRIMQTSMFVPEGFRNGTVLPEHDVVFNSIGDADRCRKSLERVPAVLAQTHARVINDPQRVLATARNRTAERLGAIAGAIVPRTERLARSAIVPAELERRGWTFPLLLRAPGYQAGRYFERVDDPGALAAALATLPGEELFAIEFVDTRAADDCVRKYRVLFIDGHIYPVHLAISGAWKVHYFSADMTERAEHRAEEERFLRDMRGVLGPQVMTVLEEIERALGLDYGGVDFGVDASGRVVVFEANATMAVYVPPAGEMFAYRRPAYDAVIAAVRGLIAARAAARAT
ncbi:MAG TPA: tetratricopeptide repeat protein [Candidatus Lustribacter sp.]|jgi:glutathione synthase/RimK-type ligase-like ATP-grasp enzyme|nr:tetratricopeptide repeat protein [Candidatus Lustribacter sp.]